MGGASQIIACRFKTEMNHYCLASGSKINLRKSQIYGWNLNPREMSDISRILNMDGTVSWDSFKYLGVPIFKLNSKCSDWNPIMEKIKKKIIGWGTAWLNLDGKVMLIKDVLNNYLLYQCSILLPLVKIINQIEVLLRSFLWNGGKNGGGKKYSLVSWKTIKLPRSEGGLQIEDLKSQNLAIGDKLLWNMLDPKPSWCSRVLKNKYFPGSRLRCLEGEHVRTEGSSIFKLCKKSLPQFAENLYWTPGNGKKIHYWQDTILGKPPPRIPGL